MSRCEQLKDKANLAGKVLKEGAGHPAIKTGHSIAALGFTAAGCVAKEAGLDVGLGMAAGPVLLEGITLVNQVRVGLRSVKGRKETPHNNNS